MVGYVTTVLGVTAVLVLVLGTPGHIAPMVSTPSPCSNGGVCNNSPGSYSCTCTGTSTQGHIAPMVSTPSPCSNSGVCNNSPGSYSYICTGTGYTGTHCTNGKYIITMF